MIALTGHPAAPLVVISEERTYGFEVATCTRADTVVPIRFPRVVGFGGAGSPQGEAGVTVSGLPSTAAFVPLVIQCASNPHYLARAASSRALAALVPPARASGVIVELLEGLPRDAADDRCFRPGAHNHIHGERSCLPLAIRGAASLVPVRLKRP